METGEEGGGAIGRNRILRILPHISRNFECVLYYCVVGSFLLQNFFYSK
jgi:hypothetical protein